MYNFSHLITMIKVVETGSFSAAAKALGLSQVAVSKQMHLLEQELKLELFSRSTKAASLTELGYQFFEQAKRIICEVQDSYELLSKIKGNPSGEIKLICTIHFSQFVEPFIGEFLEKYPETSINIEFNDRFPDTFEKENMDLLVGVSKEIQEDVIAKKLFNTKYCLLASPEYIKKNGLPKTPKDLISHYYIAHSGKMIPNMIEFSTGEEIYIKTLVKVNNTRVMRRYALEGLGITLLQRHEVKDFLQDGSLIELLPEHFKREFPTYLYYLKRKFILPKVRCFIDFFYPKIMTLQN